MITMRVDEKHDMCFYSLMNRMSHYRKKLRLNQTEVGRRLFPALGQSAVSSHEKGTRIPDVYQAIQYSEILNAPIEELFPFDRDVMVSSTGPHYKEST